MRLSLRRERLPEEVRAAAGGERVLAHVHTPDGRWLLGTRGELVMVEPTETIRLRWEEVQDAHWNREESRFRVTGVGEYGRPRPAYVFELDDPRNLLQLIRERVTASIVVQRGVLVTGKKGFKVIGRRSPLGGPIAWMHEYDAGVDPDDPKISALAEKALAAARAEVGE